MKALFVQRWYPLHPKSKERRTRRSFRVYCGYYCILFIHLNVLRYIHILIYIYVYMCMSVWHLSIQLRAFPTFGIDVASKKHPIYCIFLHAFIYVIYVKMVWTAYPSLSIRHRRYEIL